MNNFNIKEHSTNINRRLMERDIWNKQSDNLNPQSFDQQLQRMEQYRYNDKMKQYGEITGSTFDASELDKGMPFRPVATTTTDRYKVMGDNDEIDRSNPVHVDFDLYRQHSNIEVSYHDPYKASPVKSDWFSEMDEYQDSMITTNKDNPMSGIINEFTIGFMRQFLDNLKNYKSLILSPFNILQVFAMLYIGSNTKTESDLRNYFTFPSKKSTFDNLYKINNALVQTGIISIMNLVCVPHYLNLNDGYLSYINKLGSFIKVNPDNAINDSDKINKIISRSTNGMINNVLTPDMIHSETALILISTIYFYSQWKKPFNKNYTKPELFNGITRRQVNMMHQMTETHKYFEDSANQILEIDYKDNVFAMGFVLPKDNYSQPIMNSFDQYQYYVNNLKNTQINLVKIPKFKCETKYRIDNLFKKYGLREIFNNLDISEIIPPFNNQPIGIEQIIHNAIIVVDEQGTKVSAGTIGTSLKNSSYDLRGKLINFIADHQFIYYVRHIPTNTIIFIGQYL